MKKKKTQQKEFSNVEFGMEFGDLNSSKLYEVTLTKNENKKNQIKK